MSRLRQLAERTPAGRERFVDLLRALAITVVVLGHWTVTVIEYDQEGQPTGRSALPELPWAYPLTWLAQVMPVFFLVGGFANAASLTARRRRGGDANGWLLDRSARLVRPTTMLVLVLAASALVARLRDADPVQVRTAVWFATIPLWFLAAYLVVVPLTPMMYALHRRFGLAVPLALALLVAAGDLGRLVGPATLATGNYLFGWLAVHQLGFAWYDARSAPEPGRSGLRSRRLPVTWRVALPLLLGGLVAALLLTAGPYPVSMLNVPGERLDNAAPPSLALLALTTAQLGVILLLRDRAERWLHRSGVWQAVIAVNAVVLTIFLWHLTATVLLIGALDAVHLLPTPPVDSVAWLAWRVPWLLMLTVVLAAPVALFGPIEASSGRRTRAGRPSQREEGRAGTGRSTTVRTALAVAGFAAVVLGLVINSEAPKSAPEPLGIPAGALLAYLAGAGTLRLLRSGWGNPG